MGHNDSLNSSIDSRRNNYKLPPSNSGHHVLRAGSIDSSIDLKQQRHNAHANAMSIPQTPS